MDFRLISSTLQERTVCVKIPPASFENLDRDIVLEVPGSHGNTHTEELKNPNILLIILFDDRFFTYNC